MATFQPNHLIKVAVVPDLIPKDPQKQRRATKQIPLLTLEQMNSALNTSQEDVTINGKQKRDKKSTQKKENTSNKNKNDHLSNDDQEDEEEEPCTESFNVWQEQNDELKYRGVDTDNWVDKSGNPFNIFRLYKARSGQFVQQQENLSHQKLQNHLQQLYEARSPAKSKRQKEQYQDFEDFMKNNSYKDATDYTKSALNHITFDRFKEYYSDYMKIQLSKEKDEEEEEEQEEISPNLAQSPKRRRALMKKLTVEIFNSPNIKPQKVSNKQQMNDLQQSGDQNNDEDMEPLQLSATNKQTSSSQQQNGIKRQLNTSKFSSLWQSKQTTSTIEVNRPRGVNKSLFEQFVGKIDGQPRLQVKIKKHEILDDKVKIIVDNNNNVSNQQQLQTKDQQQIQVQDNSILNSNSATKQLTSINNPISNNNIHTATTQKMQTLSQTQNTIQSDQNCFQVTNLRDDIEKINKESDISHPKNSLSPFRSGRTYNLQNSNNKSSYFSNVPLIHLNSQLTSNDFNNLAQYHGFHIGGSDSKNQITPEIKNEDKKRRYKDRQLAISQTDLYQSNTHDQPSPIHLNLLNFSTSKNKFYQPRGDRNYQSQHQSQISFCGDSPVAQGESQSGRFSSPQKLQLFKNIEISPFRKTQDIKQNSPLGYLMSTRIGAPWRMKQEQDLLSEQKQQFNSFHQQENLSSKRINESNNYNNNINNSNINSNNNSNNNNINSNSNNNNSNSNNNNNNNDNNNNINNNNNSNSSNFGSSRKRNQQLFESKVNNNNNNLLPSIRKEKNNPLVKQVSQVEQEYFENNIITVPQGQYIKTQEDQKQFNLSSQNNLYFNIQSIKNKREQAADNSSKLNLFIGKQQIDQNQYPTKTERNQILSLQPLLKSESIPDASSETTTTTNYFSKRQNNLLSFNQTIQLQTKQQNTSFSKSQFFNKNDNLINESSSIPSQQFFAHKQKRL